MILDTKVIKPLIVNWSIKFVQSYSSSFQEGFHLCSFLHSPLGTYFRKTTKNFFNKCQILPWSDDWFQWKNSFTILGKRKEFASSGRTVPRAWDTFLTSSQQGRRPQGPRLPSPGT